MATASRSLFQTASYSEQKTCWPKNGKHILALFDEESVIVYQAFKPSIAEYAVKNQRFGGDEFSFDRMSWIKTNFLWMMYRCGWASKKNQERVLAVTISRAGFEQILANAYTVGFQKSRKVQTSDIEVRLQWDPDHSPTYEKLMRRAIQLGLKGKILSVYGTEWVQRIEDITDFVHEQKKILDESGPENIKVAKEIVYPLTNQSIAARIELDFDEPAQVVDFVS